MSRSTPMPRRVSFDSGFDPVRFLVGQDQDGRWIARDASGLVGGLFATKDSALRFAAFESNRRADIVVLTPQDGRLTLAGALPPL